jgi:hypothetical protein
LEVLISEITCTSGVVDGPMDVVLVSTERIRGRIRESTLLKGRQPLLTVEAYWLDNLHLLEILETAEFNYQSSHFSNCRPLAVPPVVL